MTTLKMLVGRRWWWVTLLAIAGVAVLIRLGFWQLDRLEQRRAYNHHVWSRWTQEPYDLDPAYGERLREVAAAGVEVIAVRLVHGPRSIEAGEPLPVRLDQQD